jgi:hypothetical protein
MGELVAHLYMGLAQFFSGLFPERFQEAARTGPLWRRVTIALFVGLGSLVVGLLVAAFVLAALFLIVAVVIGIVGAVLV